MSFRFRFTPWVWFLLTASAGALLVAVLLAIEWQGMQHSSGRGVESNPVTDAPLKDPQERSEGMHPSLSPETPPPVVLSKQSSPTATDTSSLQQGNPEPVAPPVEIPTVYANPEVLGEVSPYHDEMYARVMNRFASKMQGVTATPDSPEYRRKFEEASRDADNALRALMGHDAYIRMKAAAEKGQTLQ